MYPVLSLGGSEADAHGYLHNLEEVAIRTAADFGVPAFRREGKTGAWTEAGKLAAIGVRFKHWVTQHGMSFNVDVDLGYAALIVPCGLSGERVTSLRALLGRKCPSLVQVRERMAGRFLEVLQRQGTVYHPGQPLPPALEACLMPYRAPGTPA